MATVAELAAEVSVTGVDEAGRQLDGFGKKIDDTGSKHGSAEKAAAQHEAAVRRVGTASLVAGGALLAGFGMAAGAAVQLDSALAPVGTLLGANSQAAADLRDRMTEMIASSPQSADEIGMSAYTILSSGISGTTNVMDAMRASQKLSEAGLGSMADATGLVTSAINAFKGESLTADGAARTLFGTITLGKTTTADLAQGFGEIAPLAAAAGVKFKDLLAATAALTSTGQTAATAYTGIRGAITNIIKPSADASAAAKQLGLDFSSAHLKNVGLPKFLDEVKAATGGNVDTMARLFGSVEGVNAVLALTGPQADAFAENLKKIDGAGKGLNDRAAEMEHNLGNTLATLQNKGEVALAKGIAPMIPALETMIGLVGGAADAWADLPGPLQDVTGGMVAVAGVGLTAFGLFQKFSPVVNDAKESLRGLGTVGGFAADNLGRIALGAATAFAVAGTFDGIGHSAQGSVAGVAALTIAGAQLGSVLPGVGTAAGAAGGFLIGFAKDAFTTESAASELSGVIRDLGNAVGNLQGKQAATAFLKELYGTATLSRGAFRASGDEIEYVSSRVERWAAQNPAQAAQVVAGFRSITDASGKLLFSGQAIDVVSSALERGSGKFRDNAQAARDNAGVNTAVAGAMGSVTDALSGQADAWDKADQAAKAYKTVLDNVLGIGLDVESTNLRWHDSIDAITKSLTENGATLDLNTAQGRANRQALEESTQAALGHAEAQARADGNITQANQTIGAQIGVLAASAAQMGLNDEQTLTYIEDLLGIPPEARTDIHNTADIARYATLLLENKYNEIDGKNVNTTVTADTSQAWAAVNSLESALNRLRNIPAGMPGPVGGPFANLGAHGLVGLAHGGVAGKIVGPGQPVVIGEGLSREAVVPFDNFGDMVATIAATGRAKDFARASVQAAGRQLSGSGSAGVFSLGAFTDPAADPTLSGAADQAATDLRNGVTYALNLALQNFWQAQDASQQASDEAIYRNLGDFLNAASVTGDSVRTLMQSVLDDFWHTTDEAQRASDDTLFHTLDAQLKSMTGAGFFDTPPTPSTTGDSTSVTPGPKAKQEVVAEIDWKPLIEELDTLDKDGSKDTDRVIAAVGQMTASLNTFIAVVLGGGSPAATTAVIGAL